MNDKEELLSEMVEFSIARSQSTGRVLELHRDLLEASLPPLANDLWAAGWRKMPSREELARVFYKSYAMAPRESVTLPKQMCADDYDGQTVEATQITVDPIIDAILALMGGEVSE